jgi:hypothetical protein
VKKRKIVARAFLYQIATIVFIAVGLNPAVADSLREDPGFAELAGTWIHSEYDGLFHAYEQLIWKADGTFVHYDSDSQSVRSEGPFIIVERRIESEGCLVLMLVDENDSDTGFLLIKISRRGDHCEICRNLDSGCRECRCFIRKKIYRGIPRYRFDTARCRTWLARYPFKPESVIPWTKYFCAKA